MKDLVKKVKSFITFDSPLRADYIKAQFAITHSKNQVALPEWSATATRQKMISDYWYSHVMVHFIAIIGLAVIAFLLYGFFNGQELYLPGTAIAILFAYPILYLFQYRQYFNSTYLPRLETIREDYVNSQLQNLEKCRQEQLSNFALALFFYILTKTNDVEPLKCDDHSARLLTKLYGVDTGSLKKNLELILTTTKRKNMSDRKITEMQNRFNETYDFLNTLNFKVGIEKLKELEIKFFNR